MSTTTSVSHVPAPQSTVAEIVDVRVCEDCRYPGLSPLWSYYGEQYAEQDEPGFCTGCVELHLAEGERLQAIRDREWELNNSPEYPG